MSAEPNQSTARPHNCARVEPTWHIQHTVGNKADANVVPHALFNRAADEMVEAVRECVKVEAENDALRKALAWVAKRYGQTLAGQSVRDADECLEHARLLLLPKDAA